MGEVKAGDRVWLGPGIVSHLNGQSTGTPTGAYVMTDAVAVPIYHSFDEMLPDSAQLPQVARRLAEAEQRGEDVVAVVLSRDAFESLIGAAEAWQVAFDPECDDEAVSDAIHEVREQLGGGA